MRWGFSGQLRACRSRRATVTARTLRPPRWRRRKERMKPAKLAKEYCANFQPDGGCMNTALGEDGGMQCGPELPRCRVLDHKPCRYFEEAVLPMADRQSSGRTAQEVGEARLAYARFEGANCDTGRLCPECRRQAVPRGAMRCPGCAAKRAKHMAAERARRHRRRKQAVA